VQDASSRKSPTQPPTPYQVSGSRPPIFAATRVAGNRAAVAPDISRSHDQPSPPSRWANSGADRVPVATARTIVASWYWFRSATLATVATVAARTASTSRRDKLAVRPLSGWRDGASPRARCGPLGAAFGRRTACVRGRCRRGSGSPRGGCGRCRLFVRQCSNATQCTWSSPTSTQSTTSPDRPASQHDQHSTQAAPPPRLAHYATLGTRQVLAGLVPRNGTEPKRMTRAADIVYPRGHGCSSTAAMVRNPAGLRSWLACVVQKEAIARLAWISNRVRRSAGPRGRTSRGHPTVG
jgi:hypothetical protein